MNEFEKLGIEEPIMRSINEQGFEHPSEIQLKTIPSILEGKDVIAGSATGSGKTLAFGTGIIQHIKKDYGLQALVLTPTRELALQVTDSLKILSKYKRFNTITVYGGVGITQQIHKLKTAEIVVGTPGRILDHLQRGTINLSRVKVLVLDEADRMLDMGFIDDVEKIIRQCARERQTLFFSATMPPDIKDLAHKYMKNPEKISAENQVDPKKLHQSYYDVRDNMKFSLLVHLLKKDKGKLVMVFCNSQRNTDFVADNLRLNGIDAIAIHGGFSQARREKAMHQFHSNKAHVLVCTDVAARGLDIKGVSHVYNYDLPDDSKQYIHRIGRTARAGEEGKAVNIVASRDHENFGKVLAMHDITVHKEDTPQVDRVRIKLPQRQQRRGNSRSGGYAQKLAEFRARRRGHGEALY